MSEKIHSRVAVDEVLATQERWRNLTSLRLKKHGKKLEARRNPVLKIWMCCCCSTLRRILSDPRTKVCVPLPSLEPLFAAVLFENGPFFSSDLVSSKDWSQGDTCQQMGLP